MIFVFHQIEMVWVKCQGLNEIPPTFPPLFWGFFHVMIFLGFPGPFAPAAGPRAENQLGKSEAWEIVAEKIL